MSAPLHQTLNSHLTVLVLATHEDEPLHATLDCVQEYADRLIVVDGAQSAEFAALCRARQIEYIEPTDPLHQGQMWNAGLRAVGAGWVLCLEAGETMEVGAVGSISAFVRAGADPQVAYVLMIEVPAGDGQTSGEQSAQVRLIPGNRSLQYGGGVRPALLPAIAEAEMELRHLAGSIQRGPREYDRHVRTTRAQRDLKCAQRQLDIAGESAEVCVAQGEAYAALGQHQSATKQFQHGIQIAPRGSTIQLEAYYGLLTALDSNPAAREAQLASCLEALDTFPLDAQLLCGMGSYMLAQNRADLAIRAYTIAVGHGQVDPLTWHLSDIAEVAASCLSLTYQLMDDAESAQTSLRDALTRFPQSARLRRQLLNLLIKQGAAEGAMAEFDHLPADTPQREALRCAVRGALLAAQRNWPAALPYLKTAYTAGCHDIICLRWLAVVYLSTAQIEAARPVLAQWQAIEPQSAELQTYLAAAAQYGQKIGPVRFGEDAVDASSPATDPALVEADKKLRIHTHGSGGASRPRSGDRVMPKLGDVVFEGDTPGAPA